MAEGLAQVVAFSSKFVRARFSGAVTRLGPNSLDLVRGNSYTLKASTSLIPSGSSHTVSVVFRFDSFSGGTTAAYFSKETSGQRYSLVVESTNLLRFYYSGSFLSLGTLTLGNWYHAVIVYNGTNVIGYLDTVASSSVATSGPVNSEQFTLGDTSSTGTLGNFRSNGRIAEVGVWQGTALSGAQVTSLNTHLLTGASTITFTTAPTTHWALDIIDPEGAIRDSFGNTYPITSLNTSVTYDYIVTTPNVAFSPAATITSCLLKQDYFGVYADVVLTNGLSPGDGYTFTITSPPAIDLTGATLAQTALDFVVAGPSTAQAHNAGDGSTNDGTAESTIKGDSIDASPLGSGTNTSFFTVITRPGNTSDATPFDGIRQAGNVIITEPVHYLMRAFRALTPGYVYWSVANAPDFDGTQSGYPPIQLTDIVLKNVYLE